MENIVFNVGLTLSIETYYKAYLSTRVLGWKHNAFILTDAVYVNNLPAKLKTNEPSKVRFLQNGVAYGFESEIITIQVPFPLVFIKYPQEIACLKLRVAPRFKTDLSVNLIDASGQTIPDAVMIDISEGGCGLKVPVQESRNLLPAEAYAITYQLLHKEVHLACRIKHLVKQQEAYFIGMEFSDVKTSDKETLRIFLDFLNKYIVK